MKKFINETALLKQHYQKTLDYVRTSNYFTLFAKEKIHHSFQVIGAGNYIIKHEKTFQNRSDDFMLWASLAYLFHDIGRFEEIRNLFDNTQGHMWERIYDHGEYGYQLLKEIPQYNDIHLTLPVRHHGHLMEDFYNDSLYRNIKNTELKKELEQIIFLVRDADKCANLHLLKNCNEHIESLFYYNPDTDKKTGTLSPEIWELFQKYQVIDRRLTKTVADRIVWLIGWIFDLNYKPSFDFICRSGCLNTLIKRLGSFVEDDKLQENIANIVKSYISLKYEQFKENI